MLMGEFLIPHEFRVIAPSRPGYLDTPLTDSNATPDEQADMHIALMDKLGIDKFMVMCWSGGGPSCYRLAVKYPNRVDKLVTFAAVSKSYKFADLAEENIMLLNSFGSWLMGEMVKHSPKKLVNMLPAEEGKLSKKQAKELGQYIWSHPKKRKFVLDVTETISGKNRKKGVKNDAKQFPKIVDLELSKIKVPTLIVEGTVDTDVTPEYSEYAHKHITGSEIIHIKDGTHFAVWTDPTCEQVQTQVISFLQQK